MKIGNVVLEYPVLLAPMAGVTDSAFRRICRRYGCSMVCSEMISAKAIHFKDKKTYALAEITAEEQPCAIQIFGSEPDIMAEAANYAERAGAALVDINMGCPAPKIADHGDGAALMSNPELVGQIVSAVVAAVKIPVSVKIRKGWDDNSVNALDVALLAQSCGASAVTVHGRTRVQYYAGKADWNIIKKVKQALDIPVIGNGDVFSAQDALEMLAATGCDAVMVGRGAQGNPFLFRQIIQLLQGEEVNCFPTLQEKINVLLEQIEMMIAQKGEYIAIREARKHASWYLKGEKNGAKLRDHINHASGFDQIKKILQTLT